MNFQQKVTSYIRKQQMLVSGDRVLVAVSGGPDSVALLHALCGLRPKLGLNVEVAHLEHGIRAEEAREDARFVGALAETLNLPFHLKQVDLPRLRSAAVKGNLEAMAREERYEFFGAVAREHGLSKVATAHTRDDQAETVLMWLLRGSGRKGLGGMAPMHRRRTSGLTIVRPFLGVSKADVLEFLHEEGVAYRLDRTNQDVNYLRNWIRLELLPQLKERIDSNLTSRLSQEAEILHDEDILLEDLARLALDKVKSGAAIDRHLFLEQPKALQRRLLRLWIEEARGDLRSIDFGHIEEMLKLIIEGPAQGRLAIPGRLEFVKEYGTLRLEDDSRDRKPPCYNYELRVGRDLHIPEAALIIRSQEVERSTFELPDSLMEALFDLARLPRILTVRNFRYGDLFRPLGMKGHKKVQDLFTEKKVPLSVRSTWPLLSAGEEILWIPGYARSEFAKIHFKTRHILRLRAVHHDS